MEQSHAPIDMPAPSDAQFILGYLAGVLDAGRPISRIDWENALAAADRMRADTGD